jgi:CheY-like chemotaxis protein
MTSRRILIVDDNVDSARLLEMLLDVMGHRARAAIDGAEALQLAREFEPDLILLDLSLPDIDGIELAARLRDMPALASCPLVAVTGWSDPDTVRRARAAGIREVLIKPVDPAKLEAIIGGL